MASVRSLYTRYLGPLIERVGLERTVQRWYSLVMFARHSGVESHDIAGTVAQFNVTNRTEFERFYDLSGERAVIADLLSTVEPDDVVYDVGANVGTYTCFLSHVLPEDQIIAFEPHPTNAAALRSNLALNGTSALVVEQALSDSNGTTGLAVASPDAGEGTHALATGSEERTIEVTTTTGDSLVGSGQLPAPTVVKIDVEGAEQRVLRGLRNSLSGSTCRCCYVELHPDRLAAFGDSVAGVEALLDSCGFETQRLEAEDDEPYLKAEK